MGDLAGSERAADRRQHCSKLLNDAKAINWSLSCLHECVRQVAEGTAHVPFRRTPLTRLLQGPLSAPSQEVQVVWIAHVHPSSCQLSHSLHTLVIAADVVNASLAKHRRTRPWKDVPPKLWTKSQLTDWLSETFPS